MDQTQADALRVAINRLARRLRNEGSGANTLSATSLAVLAVIAAGFMAFVGRLTWGIAGSIVFGITLVFGSAQIVQFFQSAVGG